MTLPHVMERRAGIEAVAKSQAALDDAHDLLAQARDVASALRDSEARNHFAEAVEIQLRGRQT